MRTFQLALRRAEKHLAQANGRMANLIAQQGKCGLTPYWDRSPYESLVRAVAYQQLHARAAQAILGRLVARFPDDGFPTPEKIVALPLEEFRSFGFSLAKATTIQGIAQGALSGVVPTREAAEAMTDEALVEQITTLRGIGRWTVEMLLIFTLGRLDVMPIDDFGVRVGLQSLYRLKTKASKHDFARRTESWSPYRTVGAWYLWREADRLKEVAKNGTAKNGKAGAKPEKAN
jgi:DNA-3-methyladenine glycosylase II